MKITKTIFLITCYAFVLAFTAKLSATQGKETTNAGNNTLLSAHVSNNAINRSTTTFIGEEQQYAASSTSTVADQPFTPTMLNEDDSNMAPDELTTKQPTFSSSTSTATGQSFTPTMTNEEDSSNFRPHGYVESTEYESMTAKYVATFGDENQNNGDDQFEDDNQPNHQNVNTAASHNHQLDVLEDVSASLKELGKEIREKLDQVQDQQRPLNQLADNVFCEQEAKEVQSKDFVEKETKAMEEQLEQLSQQNDYADSINTSIGQYPTDPSYGGSQYSHGHQSANTVVQYASYSAFSTKYPPRAKSVATEAVFSITSPQAESQYNQRRLFNKETEKAILSMESLTNQSKFGSLSKQQSVEVTSAMFSKHDVSNNLATTVMGCLVLLLLGLYIKSKYNDLPPAKKNWRSRLINFLESEN